MRDLPVVARATKLRHRCLETGQFPAPLCCDSPPQGRSIRIGHAMRRRLFGHGPADPDRVVMRDVTVAVERDSRVRVAGDNGRGKTSLLRALIAQSGNRSERLLYVPQEICDAECARLMDDLDAAEPELRNRLMAVTAALGIDPSRAVASARPSDRLSRGPGPGQPRRAPGHGADPADLARLQWAAG